MNQIIKQDCGQLVQNLIFKLIQEKLSVSEKLLPNSFSAVILNIMECTWLQGKLDVIIFYALKQQQKMILIERNFLAGKQKT